MKGSREYPSLGPELKETLNPRMQKPVDNMLVRTIVTGSEVVLFPEQRLRPYLDKIERKGYNFRRRIMSNAHRPFIIVSEDRLWRTGAKIGGFQYRRGLRGNV